MYVYNLLGMYICVPLLHPSVQRAEEARVCSVLQCVAVCCSVGCVAVYYNVLQRSAVCCSVLRWAAICWVTMCCFVARGTLEGAHVFQCGAVWCNVVQCVAVCCIV